MGAVLGTTDGRAALRRKFSVYLEHARAVPYHPLLHYNSYVLSYRNISSHAAHNMTHCNDD
jgi:hypothetical protein